MTRELDSYHRGVTEEWRGAGLHETLNAKSRSLGIVQACVFPRPSGAWRQRINDKDSIAVYSRWHGLGSGNGETVSWPLGDEVSVCVFLYVPVSTCNFLRGGA